MLLQAYHRNTVHPIVFLAIELAPEASANGKTPNKNAIDVIRYWAQTKTYCL